MKTKSRCIYASWLSPRPILALYLAMLIPLGAFADGAAESFRVLHHFDSGLSPQGSVAVGDGAIYGTSYRGGNFGYGTIYRINIDGSEFAILKEFAGNDGRSPQAGLVLSGTTLYGTTTSGGDYESGTIFRIQTDGSGFEALKSLNPEAGDGRSPAGSEALLLSGATLYGMTQVSGASNSVPLGWGTVFTIQTDGTGYTVLHNFSGGDESYPWASLAMDGPTLYGTTSGWATYNRGAIFKISADGSAYSCLRRFTGGADAAFPLGGVVVSGSTLFGTTYYGPGSEYPGGTVFRMKTDGTAYTLINSNLSCPRGGIVLSAGVLYGTTIYGGISNYGSVYAVTTNGAAFTILKGFTGTDGRTPWGSLALFGHTLYGTTLAGGASDGGVLFSLPSPTPFIVTGPTSQTAELGSTVRFTVEVEGPPPMKYQLLFNETNLVSSGSNPSLVLTNVQLTQAGNYRIRVTNVFGAAISSPANLNVIDPVPRRMVPGLSLSAQGGNALGIEHSEAIATSQTWLALDNVTFTSSPQWYFDLTWPLPVQRFYRTWQPGPGITPPSVDLHMIPALTLTGNSGDSVRVDGINQFGPTDAWFTLDTVTLTNTSQLYFDVTAPGQPERLYRLIPLP